MPDVAIPEEFAAVVARWRDAGSPPRPPTRWHRESWHRQLPEHRALFDDLPSELDRDAVTAAARAINGPDAAVRAFVAAMVWGYGPSGYGPFRTRRVLASNADAPRRLLETAEAARDRGPLAGFDVLAAAPMKYLGVAFSTKYLYYCSRAVSHLHEGRTAPILDSVMGRWMARYAKATFSLSTHDRLGYRRYVDLLEQWGSALDLRADVVEERIYVAALATPARRRSARPDPERAARTALEQLTAALDALGLATDAEPELVALAQLLGAEGQTSSRQLATSAAPL